MTGQGVHGEYALINGQVFTMNESHPQASAVAIRGDRVVAVGDEAGVRAALGVDAPSYDLGGAVVLPGLIDTHTHVEFIALSRHFWLDVRGEPGSAEVLKRMLDHSESLNADQWLVAQGTFGQEIPTKLELDRAFPDRPVVVRWKMHKFVVNQRALDLSGIDGTTTVPAGMRLQVDENGELNGVLEEAWDLLAVPSPPRHLLSEAIEETLRSLFLSNGVTTVHEIACTTEGLSCMQELARSHKVPRLGVLLTARPGHQPLTDFSETTLRALGDALGDDRYWIQGVKIFMDGGRDGAFRAEDLNLPANRWGLLTRLYPTLVDELTAAAKSGLQVCTHAIGDLAQEIALSAIERVHQNFPKLDHRLRIEHFFNESLDTASLSRLVAAGGIAVPNPGFVIAEPDDPQLRQPPGANKFSLRTLAEVQGIIPGNSDTAGAQPFTTNPWFTMKCMLELKNKNGVEVNPGQTLTVDQVLRSFTVDAAYATKQEKVKGQIAPGYLADLTIVDRDPHQLLSESFTEVQTRSVIVGGVVQHGDLSALTEVSEV